MPERLSRPTLVKKLQSLWCSFYTNSPYLKSVSIGDGSKLRGISNSTLELNFPVTILCGSNSTGKTTFLSLAILAFHDASALTLSSSLKGYYDFSYFYGFSEKEKHEAGIEIVWEYTDNSSDSIVKGNQRWLRYIKNNGEPRRPKRGTEFVGLSRILPAFEKRGYQRLFSNMKNHKAKTITQELNGYLERIMERSYTSVMSYETKNSAGSHRLNDYDSHTSFNAGAGEECLTYILDTLLTAKDGSIVAIEEIEIGLHPATMEKLVDAILEIALKRKLQILITTHSPDFLRASPKESLVLAERAGGTVQFTFMPNIENAVYCLSGKRNADLCLVCEDEWAGELINSCLTKKQRDIVKVVAYGGKDELFKKAVTIHGANKKKILVIWDGEVSDSYLAIQNPEPQNIFLTKLPGAFPPEQYVINMIKNDTLKAGIMNAFNLEEADWASLKNKLSGISDGHDFLYIINEFLGSSDQTKATVRAKICHIVSETQKDDFLPLKNMITNILYPQTTVSVSTLGSHHISNLEEAS